MTDWSEIVREHGQHVWKTVYRLVGNDADAADCFQETFISAMRATSRESVRNWPALLKRIATARALDMLRTRTRNSTHFVQDGNLESIDVCPQPEDLIDAEESNRQLLDAIARLSPQHAEAICLSYLEELSYSEISEHMSISVSHVGVVLHRAKARLRKLLTDAHTVPTNNPIAGDDDE